MFFCSLTAERIATFNIWNYLSMDRFVDGHYQKNYPKPEKEKAALRKIIHSVQPDILGIQEIGEEGHLLELQRDLKTEGSHFPFTVLMKGEDSVRRIAFLSKLPPVKVIRHKELSFTYFGKRNTSLRGLLAIDVLLNTHPTRIYCLHLKSRWTQRKDDYQGSIFREKEARTMRDRILKDITEGGPSRFIVLGDFNNRLNTPAIDRFLTKGKATIAHRIPAYDSRNEVWTHYYKKGGEYSLVDSILISPRLHTDLPNYKTATIYDGLNALIASDHRLVYWDISG